MKRDPVRSSNIAAVGYEPGTLTLEVEFHTGSIYQYSGVPASKHAALMKASSHGRYFNDHIKDQYRTRKVR